MKDNQEIQLPGQKGREDVDIYRDTPLRYVGYANEVGEAFRAIIGSTWVLASYGLATAYVLADTTDKALKMYNSKKLDPNREKATLYAAADTLIWQILASVVIPGFTINRTCAASNYLLQKGSRVLSGRQRKWFVTCIGLASIPFIVHPIDRFVDTLMDSSFRKLKP